MSFCSQLNSSCIYPILKGKAVSMHGSTTQRNGHISSLGQDVADLKGASHPFCTAEFSSRSRAENVPRLGGVARGRWLSYLTNIMASVSHGEEVVSGGYNQYQL